MDEQRWLQHAATNHVQTLLLLLAMMGLLGLLGALLWGTAGVYFLLALLALLLLINPNLSPALIMRLYQARQLTPQQAPELFQMLQQLALRAQLSQLPHLYYIPSRLVNAFAVGQRDDAAIAVTDGMLHNLDRYELYSVLAHEISHVRSNDMRVMGLADIFSRLTSLLSLTGQLLLFINLPLLLMEQAAINWWAIAILILAPNINALAQLGLSRTREYHADLNAVQLVGDPRPLASALVKIEQLQGGWIERVLLPGRRIPEPSLLRTHPPTEERVRRLLELHIQPPSKRQHGMPPNNRLSWPGQPVQRKPSHHIHGLWF